MLVSYFIIVNYFLLPDVQPSFLRRSKKDHSDVTEMVQL